MKGHGILDVPSNSNSPLPPLISSHLLNISVVLVTVSGTSSVEIEFGSAVFTHNLTSASNLHLNKLQKIFSQGVCFMKNTFLEPFTNKLPHVCLILEILINKK